MSRLLIRDKIRNAKDIRSERIVIPEWDNVELEVRGLSGTARSAALRESYDAETETTDLDALYPALIIAATHDPETGERVFTDEDAAWLPERAAGPLERIAALVLKLSGLDKDARKAAGKDSSGSTVLPMSPSEPTTSTSPSDSE